MNYNIQYKFLRIYNYTAVAASLLLFALCLYLTILIPLTASQIVINGIFFIALIYALIYLPKYLHLTIEPEKKFFWSLRIRWILAALILVTGLAAGGHYQLLGGGVALILGTNLLLRTLIKKKRDSLADWGYFVGTIYALTDSIALAILFRAYEANGIFQAIVASFAIHLAIQFGVVLAILFFLAFLPITGHPVIGLILLTAVVSSLLTLITHRRNRLNREQTVTDLIEFTGEARDKTERLLATSTGRLAADWNSKRPHTKDEVEHWYRENSQYYIYDLAQYHLAYKHIVFTLDVMSLARGRVLDYGAGIGDISLALAERGCDVTYFDVEGRSKQFARWQAERRNLKLKFASHHEELETYDTIIVLDVLEHLFEPDRVLALLIERLAAGGLLIASAYFGATSSHPMHLDHKLDVAGLLKASGLVDAKTAYLRYFGSEAMRRRPMFVYRKVGGISALRGVVEQTI